YCKIQLYRKRFQSIYNIRGIIWCNVFSSSDLSIRRSLVHPLCVLIIRVVGKLLLSEPESNFPGSSSLRVAPVAYIPASCLAEVSTNGSRSGLEWVSSSQHCSPLSYDIHPLPDHGDERSRSHVGHQFGEEGTLT
ncbi:hypothetical protein PMAYCL1PPCAC_12174, partial [Pristionchus mayeri]